MTLFWSRVECEAAVGSNVRSVPPFARDHSKTMSVRNLPFSLEVAWLTPPVEHRRLCHFPAQSQKRMQPPAQ